MLMYPSIHIEQEQKLAAYSIDGKLYFVDLEKATLPDLEKQQSFLFDLDIEIKSFSKLLMEGFSELAQNFFKEFKIKYKISVKIFFVKLKLSIKIKNI